MDMPLASIDKFRAIEGKFCERLVVRQCWIDGYRDFSLIRASVVSSVWCWSDSTLLAVRW